MAAGRKTGKERRWDGKGGCKSRVFTLEDKKEEQKAGGTEREETDK